MSFNVPSSDPYLNEYFTKREYGDFTPFYVTICICLVIFFALLLLNCIFCCCSEHSQYWCDKNTGNQLLIPIWTRTPHQQLPLNFDELEGKAPPPPLHYHVPDPTQLQYSTASTYPAISASYSESVRTSTPPQFSGSSREKRESDI
ncbi:uncharacterized protein wrm1 [Cloeon dipterum]|uniref:uncharacterized protein wrm1 n=1 Tax=Cloeon dipterum TaxID=197152 RepID=UPI00321F6102